MVTVDAAVEEEVHIVHRAVLDVSFEPLPGGGRDRRVVEVHLEEYIEVQCELRCRVSVLKLFISQCT